MVLLRNSNVQDWLTNDKFNNKKEKNTVSPVDILIEISLPIFYGCLVVSILP